MTRTLPVYYARNNLAKCFVILLWLLPSFTVHAWTECDIRPCQQSTAGEFEMSMSDGSKRPALLLETEVVAKVAGMIASVNVSQNFKNETDQWISGRYVFPLPADAAVDSLKIRIGDRLINGIVQEKKQAQKTFQKAKKSGKKAGLLKQHRPNLFSVSVANIAPNENIVVDIHYVDKVQYENQIFSMRFPTTLTPRYIPGIPPPINSNSARIEERRTQLKEPSAPFEKPSTTVDINHKTGWAANTVLVNDARQITPPQIHLQSRQAMNLFSFKLSVDAGLALSSVTSSSHAITHNFNTTSSGRNLTEVSLSNHREPMDSDLLVQWQPNVGTAPQAALFKQSHTPQGGGTQTDYYSMLMVTPPAAGLSQSLPRDITFIIDSSGSMAGTSMQQAKQSLLQGLQALTNADKFNVVDFDSEYRTLFSQSQIATVHNIQKARSMIHGLTADGGTEMLAALNFSLTQREDDSYLKQIIFITDGSIGNEAQLFKLITKKLGNARLFTIGIGSAPNTHFMNKAAKFGRGSYTYVSDSNQVNTKIQELFRKINQAKLRNIKINWPTEVEQYPKRVPDLYAGQPILVIAKSKQAIDNITIEGQLLDKQWQQTINNPVKATKQTHSENINTLWARDKIQALTEQLHDPSNVGDVTEGIKTNITELGIAHHLVTKFTSFVAVEQISSRPQSANDQHASVANLMPKGSTMPPPSTATGRDLYFIFGGFLLFFAWLVLCTQAKPSRDPSKFQNGLASEH